MWFSSNSATVPLNPAQRHRRRSVALFSQFALLGACALVLPITGLANLIADNPINGMKRRGSGEFRRFGFLVYEATLWIGGSDPTTPPLALKLTYKRNIAGKDIAKASVKEMRRLDIADETQLTRWGEQMEKIFPDVRPGDHIIGRYLANGAQFFLNDKFVGAIDNAAFAHAFFGIWLDAKTSAPDLRNALLQTQTF